jgi:hypothetical protein
VKKTITLFAILIPFFISAVYLCPCKVGVISKSISLSRSHDCCERMKNCPAPKGQSKGMMSMLSVLQQPDARVEVPARIAEAIADLTDLQDLPVIESLPFEFNLHLQTHSPPELYLKHSVLLI